MSKFSRRGFLGAAVAVTGSSVLRAQSASSTGTFVRTPTIQNVSASEATLLWTMPSQHVARVVVTDPDGKTRSYDAQSTKFDASLTGLDASYYQYRATLYGLTRDTQYQYHVEASGVPLASPLSRPLQFRTEGPGAFRFLHFADAGEGSPEQFAVARQMHQHDVDFVLANGDLAYDLATHSSIENNYYGVYRELMAQVPFFATLGNHEYYTDAAKPSLSGRVHPVNGVPSEDWGRYYSFDWANAHFVALDTNLPLQQAADGTGAMLRWLEQDLANTRKFWRIAFFHHPGYATGKHASEPEAARVRDHIVPILEKNGVQLVLNGHEHTYQRTYELRSGNIVDPNSGGIVYVTAGGGGASPSYFEPNAQVVKSAGINHYIHADVAGATLQFRANGMGDAGEIDTLQLQPKPQISTVVNAASYTSEFAGGSAITIFGRNLFAESASGGVLEAHGSSVRLNGEPLPILFADALQVNVQLPARLGDATLEVRTPNGSATWNIQMKASAPALFANPGEPGTALATASGALITSETPAGAGQTVSLFATGLRSGDPVYVRFGNAEVDGQSATTSFAGVWEVKARVPENVGVDGIPVQVATGGVRSNQLRLPVAQ